MATVLIQITDTHIRDQQDAEFKQVKPYYTLQRVLAHIRQVYSECQALVITGDLTHDGGESAYVLLQELCSTLPCPCYVTPGNHDSEALILSHLINDQIHMPEHIPLDGWQLLFADSRVEGEVYGELSNASLKRLEETLLNHEQSAILFTHHPPVSLESRWIDELGLKNREQFLLLVENFSHMRAIAFGHAHQQWHSQYQDIEILGTPSSCVQFMTGEEEFALDTGLSPGYRVLELGDQGDLNTYVVRVSQQIEKIISGGQTGVDRAGLDVARLLSIPHGGWCPKGRRAEDGPIALDYALEETPETRYLQRTEWNVRDSDGTLILSQGQASGGTKRTRELCEQLQRPHLVLDMADWHNGLVASEKLFENWLHQHHIKTLNIAGPRNDESGNIYTQAKHHLLELLTPLE